jgi:hypothetical protein
LASEFLSLLQQLLAAVTASCARRREVAWMDRSASTFTTDLMSPRHLVATNPEAALLGAIASDDSAVTTREGQVDGQSESEVKRKTIDRRAERAKSLLKKTRVAGCVREGKLLI